MQLDVSRHSGGGGKLSILTAWSDVFGEVGVLVLEFLCDLPLRLPTQRPGCESVYHQYTIRLRNRDEVRAALAERGVETGVHYPHALHQQPGFDHLGLPPGTFPVAESCADEVLCLPMFPHLSADAVEHVADCLRQILG